MAQITIQHGCGHDRVMETPGPEDPAGLLARKAATRGAVHRAPASKCPACESALPVAFPIDALQTSVNDELIVLHPFDWGLLLDPPGAPPDKVIDVRVVDKEKSVYEILQTGQKYRISTEVAPTPAAEVWSKLQTNVNPADVKAEAGKAKASVSDV